MEHQGLKLVPSWDVRAAGSGHATMPTPSLILTTPIFPFRLELLISKKVKFYSYQERSKSTRLGSALQVQQVKLLLITTSYIRTWFEPRMLHFQFSFLQMIWEEVDYGARALMCHPGGRPEQMSWLMTLVYTNQPLQPFEL